MYVMRMQDVLQVSKVVSHANWKEGKIFPYDESFGAAVFLSH